jgi:predicted metalloprotease with PDZ domain
MPNLGKFLTGDIEPCGGLCMNEEWELEQELPLELQAPLDQPKQAEASLAIASASPLQLMYEVLLQDPASHLFEVRLRIVGWDVQNQPLLNLKMPVWTPGSYLVREYARQVQDFAAFAEYQDGTAQSIAWRKQSKNHWQVDVPDQAEAIAIHYRVFANELSVRTNHLDITHGYFNGAALFFYIPGFKQHPIQVVISPPSETWQITTTLPKSPDQANQFLAPDFDTLVDSPFEMGRHHIYNFDAENIPHQLAVWGHGNLQPESLITDIQRIIKVEAAMFGGLPYDRYLFLLHLSSQGFGGLEHKNCCSLIYQRFGFRNKDKYDRFLQLVAHEFFHLWNVKRIRPKALETFDYEQENYTPSLWFSEGTTSFYDLVIPYRAGIYDARTYLTNLSKEITRFLTTPGRQVQPLSESSFDAWIKLYRQDANSPNSQISYYLKGEMVSLVLDLLIRSRQNNKRSLDDVMRQLWEQFGKPEIGFTPEQLEEIIASVADTDLSDFFQRYLHSTEELPFDQYLAPFGLRLIAEKGDTVPYLGLMLKTDHNRELIKFVESCSPAQQAGMDAGDELLAINGIRLGPDQLGDRLRDYQPGDIVQIAFFHQDELRLALVTLAEPRPTRYHVVPVERPTRKQEQHFQAWLGVSLAEVK